MDINQSNLTSRNKAAAVNKGSSDTRSVSDTKASPAGHKVSESSLSPASSSLRQFNLQEGRSVKGRIIDLRYNEVTLQLEPGKQVITARISGNIPLSIGEEASFQVQSEAGSPEQLVLKYVPDESANSNEAAVRKALASSNLPLTERNRTIVSELIRHRMPIDKQTLQQLVKLAVIHRTASPLTLILMHKHQLPMTQENIRQYEAYQKGTHQLLRDIMDIAKGITEAVRSSIPVSAEAGREQNNTGVHIHDGNLTDMTGRDGNLMLSGSSMNTVIRMNEKLLDILLRQAPSSSSLPGSVQTGEASFTLISKLQAIWEDQSDIIPAPLSDILSPGELMELSNILEQNQMASPTAANISGSMSGQLTAGILTMEEAMRLLHQQGLTKPYDGPQEADINLSSFMTPEESRVLINCLEDIPENRNTPDLQALKASAANGSIPMRELLRLIRQTIPLMKYETVRELLASPEYARLTQEAFLQRWTIAPDKTARKASVAEFFYKLEDDLSELRNIINSGKDSGMPADTAEPVRNMQENLHFIKDLNEAFAYLQLPVQLKGRQAHTDLYVMTRKKAAGDSSEHLSVLLHLEMAYLGSLNVYLKMSNDHRLQADFYIENEESGRIIKENLSSLTDALEKKGYIISSDVKSNYTRPDFSRDFIEQSSPDHDIRRYTFDIRT